MSPFMAGDVDNDDGKSELNDRLQGQETGKGVVKPLLLRCEELCDKEKRDWPGEYLPGPSEKRKHNRPVHGGLQQEPVEKILPRNQSSGWQCGNLLFQRFDHL